jgi:hypothetical protein
MDQVGVEPMVQRDPDNRGVHCLTEMHKKSGTLDVDSGFSRV